MTNKIKVKALNSFYTIVSAAKIAKGETILTITGKETKNASKYSIQISQTIHLLPQSADPADPLSAWRFLNHSCSPNSYIDLRKMALVALSDIPEEEEVRFNYHTTEFEISSPFICRCNSINCYGEIRGFRHLPAEEQKKLTPYLAPHLKINIPLPTL